MTQTFSKPLPMKKMQKIKLLTAVSSEDSQMKDSKSIYGSNLTMMKYYLTELTSIHHMPSFLKTTRAYQTVTSFILHTYFEIEKFDTKQLKTKSKN